MDLCADCEIILDNILEGFKSGPKQVRPKYSLAYLERINKLIELCKEPRTINELMTLTGYTECTIRNYIRSKIGAKYLQVNNRTRPRTIVLRKVD
jgi:hypothetical protein